jgi:putative transposase
MFRVLKSVFCGLISSLKRRESLVFEVVALRHQIAVLQSNNRVRPRLNRWDRILWVWLSKRFEGWRASLVIVQPNTVIRWHRSAFKIYWHWKSRSGQSGRPKVDRELRDLIGSMASENLWRAPRIHKELVRLGFDVSERTIMRYMPKSPSSETARQNWKTFLKNHRHSIAAMDLFVVPTITFRLVYGFFVIHHDRRRVLHANVTEHPTAVWIIQQLREAFPWDSAPKYLIFDNDSIFSTAVRGVMESIGITTKRTAYRSPWQNGVAERWIGCLRQSLLHHVIVMNEDHLRQLLRDYVGHFNVDRCHCTLAGDSPDGRPVENKPSADAKVVALPRLGGLHHRYAWKQAA